MPRILSAYPDPSTHVAVWRVDETLDDYTDHERQRLPEEIRHRRRQLEWLATRRLLSSMSGLETPKIIYDENGKPSVSGDPREISISHSHGMVAVMLSDYPVGIDIQHYTHKVIHVRHKFCSKKELMATEQFDDSARRLHIIWSAKEALYKLYARGKMNFIGDLHVSIPTNLRHATEADGLITIGDFRLEVSLGVRWLGDWVLVYTIPNPS